MDKVILNKKTGRYIAIGSRVYNDLIKNEIIENHYKKPNELYTIVGNPEIDNIEINKIKKSLPPQFYAAKYKNKIIKKKRALNINILTDYTMAIIKKVSEEILKKHDADNPMSDDELKLLISKSLIYEMTRANSYIDNQPDEKYELY